MRRERGQARVRGGGERPREDGGLACDRAPTHVFAHVWSTTTRGPQSSQSPPKLQREYSEPSPPSSQRPSLSQYDREFEPLAHCWLQMPTTGGGAGGAGAEGGAEGGCGGERTLGPQSLQSDPRGQRPCPRYTPALTYALTYTPGPPSLHTSLSMSVLGAPLCASRALQSFVHPCRKSGESHSEMGELTRDQGSSREIRGAHER